MSFHISALDGNSFFLRILGSFLGYPDRIDFLDHKGILLGDGNAGY